MRDYSEEELEIIRSGDGEKMWQEFTLACIEKKQLILARRKAKLESVETAFDAMGHEEIYAEEIGIENISGILYMMREENNPRYMKCIEILEKRLHCKTKKQEQVIENVEPCECHIGKVLYEAGNRIPANCKLSSTVELLKTQIKKLSAYYEFADGSKLIQKNLLRFMLSKGILNRSASGYIVRDEIIFPPTSAYFRDKNGTIRYNLYYLARMMEYYSEFQRVSDMENA